MTNSFYICIALLALAIILKQTPIKEGLSTLGTYLPGWSRNISGHQYSNLCLTDKPYGFPSHDNMYQYWKDRPKSWAVEYSEERVRGDIDTVRSNRQPDTVLNGSHPASVPTSSK